MDGRGAGEPGELKRVLGELGGRVRERRGLLCAENHLDFSVRVRGASAQRQEP